MLFSILFITLGLMVNTHVMGCLPGENLWQMNFTMCSTLDSLNNCLVGTAITSLPYTISASGLYYLCESITINNAAPAITIAADNVYLNLNGQAIVNSGGIGISANGQSNIYIGKGTITPLNQAIQVLNGSNIQIIDITAVDAASVAFDLENITNLLVDNCVVNGVNGVVLGSSACILISGCQDARIRNSMVTNPTTSNPVGILIQNIAASSLVECINCVVDGAITGFQATTTTPFSDTSVVFQDCIALNSTLGIGFSALNLGQISCLYKNCSALNFEIGFQCNSCEGIIYENCIAESGAQGFISIGSQAITYKNCTSNFNGIQAFRASVCDSILFDFCLATRTPAGSGFTIDSACTNCIIANSIASRNSSSGINNAGTNTFIVDSRSQHASTTDNPAYNLNGANDVTGTATVIITS